MIRGGVKEPIENITSFVNCLNCLITRSLVSFLNRFIAVRVFEETLDTSEKKHPIVVRPLPEIIQFDGFLPKSGSSPSQQINISNALAYM